MGVLCKVWMLGESSKQCKLFGKPTIASLPHSPSQLPTYPIVREQDGMRSKRSPLIPRYLAGGGSKERVPSLAKSIERTPTGTPGTTHPPSK